jgi:hypothetical protein
LPQTNTLAYFAWALLLDKTIIKFATAKHSSLFSHSIIAGQKDSEDYLKVDASFE